MFLCYSGGKNVFSINFNITQYGLVPGTELSKCMFLIAYRTRNISLRVPALILQNVKRAWSLKLAYVPYNFYAIQIYLEENVWHQFWRRYNPKKYLAGQNKERFVAWTGDFVVQYLMPYGTFFTVQAILQKFLKKTWIISWPNELSR